MEARMGNTDVARDLYRRGLRRCPEHAALWSASAKLEGETGEHERARRLFRQVRHLPTSPHISPHLPTSLPSMAFAHLP